MAQDAAVNKVGKSVSPAAPDFMRMTRPVEVYKSSPVLYTDTTSVNLFELPPYSVVVGAWVNVTSAFDASGTSVAATATITVQNDTGTETIWDAANVGLQATGFKAATGPLGTVLPASGGFVALAYTPSTTTVGALEVYVEVLQIQDLVVT